MTFANKWEYAGIIKLFTSIWRLSNKQQNTVATYNAILILSSQLIPSWHMHVLLKFHESREHLLEHIRVCMATFAMTIYSIYTSGKATSIICFIYVVLRYCARCSEIPWFGKNKWPRHWLWSVRKYFPCCIMKMYIRSYIKVFSNSLINGE